MTTKPIQVVEGQPELWAQLCPFGEFPATIDGKPVKQVCDEAAFNRVVGAFSGEVLLDAEHHSLDATGDTSAYGWIQALKVDPAEGLLCKLRLTDLGEGDVVNRRRRHLSPVWPLDAEGRPVRLVSAALTNTPNIRMRPVLNKAAPDPSPATAAGQTKPTTERIQNMDTKEIALALGLAENATAEEIAAAAKAAAEKAATLEARVAELEKAALAAEAETVAAANSAKLADPAKFKELYVANKAFALQLLATVAALAPRQTVANKAEAKPPAEATRTAANKLAEYEAMPSGKAKDEFLAANKAELLRLDAQKRAQG